MRGFEPIMEGLMGTTRVAREHGMARGPMGTVPLLLNGDRTE